MLCALPPSGAWALDFDFVAEAEANLIYHLDCLSRTAPCNRNEFASLWSTFDQADDHRYLNAWKRLRGTIGQQRFSPEPAGLASHPFDSALAEESRGLPVPGAEAFAILAHFQPRFERWWSQGPQEHAARMQRGFKRQVNSAKITTLMGALAKFHGVDTAGLPQFQVTIVTAPARDSLATHAEVHGSETRIETLLNEPSKHRFGVVSHEFGHFLYGQTSSERRIVIRSWFLDNQAAWSITAYQLFNEALAAAFGNGLIEEQLVSASRFAELLAQPQSFYADPYVDSAAKAVLPLLRNYLENNKTLDRAFVDAYVREIGKTMAPQMTDLAFWLRNMVFAASGPEVAALGSAIPLRIRIGAYLQERLDEGCQQHCLLARYPELGGIIVSRSNRLDRLDEIVDAPTLAALRRESTIAGYSVRGIKRSDRSLLYIVTGETTGDVATGLEKLLSRGRIFTGRLN